MPADPASIRFFSFVTAPFGAEVDSRIRIAAQGQRPAPVSYVFNPKRTLIEIARASKSKKKPT
jgi:hypothetical protein